MADGRNHVPCCVQERVPDICQDVCRGEFTPVTDNIKTHYSCAAYMEKTLACIVEGIGMFNRSFFVQFAIVKIFKIFFAILQNYFQVHQRMSKWNH